MVICQDLLECDHMLVIHHTDCGGQVARYYIFSNVYKFYKSFWIRVSFICLWWSWGW